MRSLGAVPALAPPGRPLARRRRSLLGRLRLNLMRAVQGLGSSSEMEIEDYAESRYGDSADGGYPPYY